MPERIDLSRADDPRDVVHKAVACLAQGGVIGLPTESSYGIAASVLQAPAVERLRRMVPLEGTQRTLPEQLPTLFLRGPGEVDDWAVVATEVARRLTRRAWPGPVTLVLPAQDQGLTGRLPPEVLSFLRPGGLIALRAPSYRMTREILRLLPGPLIQIDPPPLAGGHPSTADDLVSLTDLDMILDVGTTQPGGSATVVDLSGDGWKVLKPGKMPEQTLAQMAGVILLFICTGNTCRSPMAEALCKVLLARRLGCSVDDLVARGYVVLSAGVSAMDGMAAAANAVEVVRLRGGSLEDHASRKASPDLVRLADHIIAMTADHLEVLLERVPEAASRSRLLDPLGEDIADPVGLDRDTYRRTAEDIEEHLSYFLNDIGIWGKNTS